jgi:hypothetical protein
MWPEFFYSNLSFPSSIATCTALHAIRRFRRQYCSRSSNTDKYIFFLYFQNFLLFSERGKKLLYVTHMQSLMMHYLKGLLAPFCFRSKRYRIPFCSVQKGIRKIPFRANGMLNPRIAYNADNVSNIPLRELSSKFKKKKQVLKFCLPSAVLVRLKFNPTIPLEGQSNLVRRYL